MKKYLKGVRLRDSEAANCAGLIVEQTSPSEAVEFYKKALEFDNTNSDAMYNLAILYLSDTAEKEWHGEAIEIIRRSAGLGNALAKEYLYKNGVSLSHNKVILENEQ